MIGKASYRNQVDDAGNPDGGTAIGIGMDIRWQKGPLGRGPERVFPNGAFVETVIQAVTQRIKFYQDSKFACDENADAIAHLEAAAKVLNQRTDRREASKTEGTHEGS